MLQRGEVMNMNIVYYVENLSAIFQILRSGGSDKKRERDSHEDENRPGKRVTIVTSN